MLSSKSCLDKIICSLSHFPSPNITYAIDKKTQRLMKLTPSKTKSKHRNYHNHFQRDKNNKFPQRPLKLTQIVNKMIESEDIIDKISSGPSKKLIFLTLHKKCTLYSRVRSNGAPLKFCRIEHPLELRRVKPLEINGTQNAMLYGDSGRYVITELPRKRSKRSVERSANTSESTIREVLSLGKSDHGVTTHEIKEKILKLSGFISDAEKVSLLDLSRNSHYMVVTTTLGSDKKISQILIYKLSCVITKPKSNKSSIVKAGWGSESLSSSINKKREEKLPKKFILVHRQNCLPTKFSKDQVSHFSLVKLGIQLDGLPLLILVQRNFPYHKIVETIEEDNDVSLRSLGIDKGSGAVFKPNHKPASNSIIRSDTFGLKKHFTKIVKNTYFFDIGKQFMWVLGEKELLRVNFNNDP